MSGRLLQGKLILDVALTGVSGNSEQLIVRTCLETKK